MKITVLCTSPDHPVNLPLADWARRRGQAHSIQIARRRAELTGGDVLLLVSCGEIIRAVDRARFSHTLVLHASDLPRGRGWSPHIWDIIGGAETITVTLLEAADKVDTGRIWHQVRAAVPPGALWDEINQILFAAEIDLLDFAVDNLHSVVPRAQDPGVVPDYHRLRVPEDSRVDPARPLAEQFDLIRTCDPHRYPAYLDHRGHRYRLILEKMDE
jgi:methionyl-tRNA formyltransferase